MTAIAKPRMRMAPGGFPVWMPSMFVKELRQGLRAREFIGAFGLLQAAMAILMLTMLALTPDSMNAGMRAARLRDLDGIFWLILVIFLLGIVPVGGMIGLRAEIESRRIDLLVLTRLNAWRIVLGKWTSLMVQAVLVLTSTLPFGMIRYFSGTVNLKEDAVRFGLLLVGSGVLSAGALWASSFGRILGLVLSLPVLAAQFGASAFILVALTWSGSNMRFFVASGALLPVAVAGFALLVFCLVSAVRQIAPPAENYTALVRGLGLLAIAPLPISSFFNISGDGMVFAAVFSMLFVLLICLIELASGKALLSTHARKFLQLGKIRPLLVPFVLPGWQTAIWYILLMAVLMMGGVLVSSIRPEIAGGMAWVILHGLGALAFTTVVASYFPDRYSMAARFFLVVLLAGLFAGLAIFLSETLDVPEIMYGAALVPVAGLFLAFDNPPTSAVGGLLADGKVMFQCAVILGIYAAATMRAQYYWVNARELSRRVSGRDPEKAAAPISE